MAIKVKICGLTNLVDAQVATECGADFLGFIFHPKSPRYVRPDQVAEILSVLAIADEVQTVGVFVNTSITDILSILSLTGLKLAQLHGDEPEGDLKALNGRGYKALRPFDASQAMNALAFSKYPTLVAPQLFLDAYHPSAYGGTGQLADWSLAASIAKQARLMLAGGLTPLNVHDAIVVVSPWAVDVSSGVEASPGQKDHAKVRAFITNARAAS